MSLFHRSEGKPVLIADVGDASVAVAIVRLAHGAPAQVLFSLREMLSPEERPREQAAVAIQALLESVITKVLTHKTAVHAPHAMYTIIRAPWSEFRTSEAQEATTEARVISKNIIGALAQRALSVPKDKASNSVLEAGVLQVFLNGYPTANPLGKRAKSVQVVAFESTIDPAIKEAVTHVFGKLLPGRIPTLYSGMRALLVTMQSHLPHVGRFIVLDIGGSQSACAILHNEMLAGYASVPEGLSTILRRIAPNAIPDETLSLMRMLASETCATNACAGIKEKISISEPELVRIFGETFAKLATPRRLPDVALLSAPTELSPWLESFFSRIDFSQFTSTTQPLRVESLSPEHLTETVFWAPGVTPETGIGVSASSVNILTSSA